MGRPEIKNPPDVLGVSPKANRHSFPEALVSQSKFSPDRDLPTILFIEDTAPLAALAGELRSEGYFVLDAHTADAITIARMHSRAIHLLVIEGSAESRTLAAQLRLYRPKMHVLFVALDDAQLSLPNVVSPGFVLERVRQLIRESFPRLSVFSSKPKP